MSSDWSFARGGALEDTVARLMQTWGFEVQTRVRAKDKSGIEHEIDVLGSKTEPFGTFTIAVECKNMITPIDIKEIRNFNDKLSSLGLSKGLFVSMGGYTTVAVDYAKSIGLELWDSATFREKLGAEASSSEIIRSALPISASFKRAFVAPHLENGELLQLTHFQLTYHPYYFVHYHCFTQDRVGGTQATAQLVNLESKGMVVLNALDGQILDSATESGVRPALPSTGYYGDCDSLATTNLPKSQATKDDANITELNILQAKFQELKIRETTQLEVAKNTWTTYNYNALHYERGRRINTTNSKTIRPRVTDVGILSVKMINVPLIAGNYSYLNRKYRRIVQAASNKVIADDLVYCNVVPNHKNIPNLVCKECGSLACPQHGKHCSVCGKPLCNQHILSKGMVMKKHYCREHVK